MKTKLLILGCIAASATKVFAVMGVGDVVVVAANPAQELLWASQELPKWIEMIDQAKQQVQRAQEAIDVLGHPEKYAQEILSKSMPAADATKLANAIKSSEEIVDFTKKSWALFKEDGQRIAKDTLEVAQNFEVLGETVARDAKRYVTMAAEKALRNNLNEVLKAKQELDAKELELQKSTLDEISHAKTQAELVLHQTALAASKVRMEAMASRVKQAETELQNFLGNAELEVKKDGEQLKEMSDAAVKEIQARLAEIEAKAG